MIFSGYGWYDLFDMLDASYYDVQIDSKSIDDIPIGRRVKFIDGDYSFLFFATDHDHITNVTYALPNNTTGIHTPEEMIKLLEFVAEEYAR